MSEKLRELVAKWRRVGNMPDERLGDWHQCADELEAALRDVGESAPPAEADGLEGVPGMWECPTCGFILTKNYISADPMRVGVNRNDECELCPNDGARLTPLSWKKACENQEKYIADLHVLLDKSRIDLAALRKGATKP